MTQGKQTQCLALYLVEMGGTLVSPRQRCTFRERESSCPLEQVCHKKPDMDFTPSVVNGVKEGTSSVLQPVPSHKLKQTELPLIQIKNK